MGDIGKTQPGFYNGEEIRKWVVPIAVFVKNSDKDYVVEAIYEDEGVLCIDVREKDTNGSHS